MFLSCVLYINRLWKYSTKMNHVIDTPRLGMARESPLECSAAGFCPSHFATLCTSLKRLVLVLQNPVLIQQALALHTVLKLKVFTLRPKIAPGPDMSTKLANFWNSTHSTLITPRTLTYIILHLRSASCSGNLEISAG